MSEQFDHEIEEVLGVGDAGDDTVDYRHLRQAEHHAHRIAGAVYGTILATTVVAALGAYPDKLEKSIFVVLFTSLVFYLAHVYALIIAARMVAGRRLSRTEVRGIAAAEWPMLQSSWPVLLPLLLGVFGWIPLEAASNVAMFMGIGALFVYGVLLGIRERRGLVSLVFNALVVGSFGVLILALKILVH